MYCNQCGAANPDDANFCGKCGKALAKESTPQSASVTKHEVSARPIRAIARESTPQSASVTKHEVSARPNALPPLEILATRPDPHDSGGGIWVGLVALALVFALFFLYPNSKTRDETATGAQVSASASSSRESRSPPKNREGKLSATTVGCRHKEGAEKFQSLRAAGDRDAMNLMLLSGLCELVYSGTRLDMDDLSLFGISSYRLYGTARTLYVLNPEFE